MYKSTTSCGFVLRIEKHTVDLYIKPMTTKPTFIRYLAREKEHFFLFGPRGVGKSTWLKQAYTKAFSLSLLDNQCFLDLSQDPSSLRQRVAHLKKNDWVIIDEIQKLPALLDEVHLLMEKSELRFALTGSSARKLKRSGANLLASRAVILQLGSLVSLELGKHFNLDTAIRFGGLPLVWVHPDRKQATLRAYVSTYLKEEILEERIVRKVEPFARFLKIAGLLNGQILNIENIAREAKVAASTVKQYIEILEDTLIAKPLPSYRPGIRIRESESNKLYWFDPGVARAAAGIPLDDEDPIQLGFAFETWMLHELRSYLAAKLPDATLGFYRTHHQEEIDFVIETRPKTIQRPAEVILIETKNSLSLESSWFKLLTTFEADQKVKVLDRYLLYRGKKSFTHTNGVKVMEAQAFLKDLWGGKLLGK